MVQLTQMNAAVLDAANSSFRIAQVARPTPKAGEVLVRIKASGVNPLDLKIRAGAAAHAQQPLPSILGIDMAGTIEAIGADVRGFAIGDDVFGMTGGVGGVQGSLAEFAAVDARLIARKPGKLSHREAAALPLIFITSWEGLVDRAHVKAGQKVLIQGGGGVGHIVVQLARSFDATAFAVDSAAKHEFLTGLGATAIDYRSMNVEQYVSKFTDGHGFDIIYDTIGGETLDASFRAVRRFGHVVSALGWGTHALAPLSFRAASYSGVFTLLPLLTGEGREHHGEILAQAAKLVDAGKIRPRVDPRRFSLQTVEEAYRAIEERGASGKIIVEID